MPKKDERPFANITAETLRSNEGLGELYLEAVRLGWWDRGNAAVLEFWCLAEKALQDDTRGTPGRLFHSLVKEKATGRVTNDHEARALARMPGQAREELAARAASRRPAVSEPQVSKGSGERLPSAVEEEDVAVFDAPGVGYHHSLMMMCFLPQKPLPEGERIYETRHGRAALRVVAGGVAKPDEVGVFKECPVPFGSRARVILPYINGFAVQNRTREVDLGASLRKFLDKIGMSYDGRRGRQVTEQIEAIAAAHIMLGVWGQAGTETRYGRVADEISFWLERDENQRLMWQPSMLLSDQYFEVLQERPVPVDMAHLMKLARSPRRMDLYSWLTYRTSRISKGQVVRIRLEDLQSVFGPDIASKKDFRAKLRRDLAAIGKVYRGFKVSIEGDILVLRASPPPIPETSRTLLS